MSTKTITPKDLRDFKHEMLRDFKKLLDEYAPVPMKKYMRSSEVMELLKISSSTLQTMRINGTLPYIKMGSILFYEAEEIHKAMMANKIHHKYK